jgi:hypothetical protein
MQRSAPPDYGNYGREPEKVHSNSALRIKKIVSSKKVHPASCFAFSTAMHNT